jgi:hypothetical protein
MTPGLVTRIKRKWDADLPDNPDQEKSNQANQGNQRSIHL